MANDIDVSIRTMTLADVLGMNWALSVRCLACRHEHEWTMVRLARTFRTGLGASVTDWASRMRCSACGERRLRVSPRQGGAFAYMAYTGEEGRREAFTAWLAGLDAEQP